ncbi:roadblock/LC7 domain-containing protein [Saccharothrix sp. AJ9571]|nr:roadblock/LC7 domain-containing protein [Saccharothrix sp. AJ9571]
MTEIATDDGVRSFRAITRIDAVRAVVAASADGVKFARSEQVSVDQADMLASWASSIRGLAHAIGRHPCSGIEQAFTQTVVEFGDCLAFVRDAANRSLMVVLTTKPVNAANLSVAMDTEIAALGGNLAVPGRATTP